MYQDFRNTDIDKTAIDPNHGSISPGMLKVIKRNGTVVPYDESKILLAMTKAFLAIDETSAALPDKTRNLIQSYTRDISDVFRNRLPSGGTLHIEEIQDQVELHLMRGGEHKIARRYVLYRDKRAQERETSNKSEDREQIAKQIPVTSHDGKTKPLDIAALHQLLDFACENLEHTSTDAILKRIFDNLYQGIPENEIFTCLLITAKTFIEKDPQYSFVAARLLSNTINKEALHFLDFLDEQTSFSLAPLDSEKVKQLQSTGFSYYIKKGIEKKLLTRELLLFDLDALAAALKPERDDQFSYLGLQTLYDRYFIHFEDTRFELPQWFFMRVAMGLALNESDKNDRAIEFYNLLSSFDFLSSTPTLFNSATVKPQLSSCYLSTIPDDLEGIYNSMRDNALLSKWAGGLGNDWSQVRALGANIQGTNGKSQGIVPFLKVLNDTAVAVNQGGKRKGAVCAYLETWHLDIEEFLELRKNTGDDRRRTHDMNTANWIPDLFMKRVFNNEDWTLFSPNETPDLHGLFGKEFEARYHAYEAMIETGQIKQHKKVSAESLWKKMLSMLFETGHPWITFKDTCNIRSPQRHVGTVHSSNLCTEITLNTSEDEIAVCNLGSLNIANHITDGELDIEKIAKTVRTAVRMLDNVIDLNYYAVRQARNSNLRHRPIGLGIMGFQDALYMKKTPYASQAAVDFADKCSEIISYYAINTSSDLALERGSYETFEGSLWSRGILPIDSLTLLAQERGKEYTTLNFDETLDWQALRRKIQQQGMRNSNLLAIAPTATIANIVGVSQSIEPAYQNLYVKSNLSGEFTVINKYLVEHLKSLGLWDKVMLDDLKYYDGSITEIRRIPDDVKALYATAFEIEPRWLVDAASRRQKWLDQAQSLNLYLADPSGRKLDIIYRMAWILGLKTTYYLRSRGATSTEKSTYFDGKLNSVSGQLSEHQQPQACSILDEDCEACQ